MKQTAYIFAMAAVLVAGCSKEAVTPAQEDSPQTATLVFTPEYDMEVDVKSAEIGKSDIWCFLYSYDYDTSTYTYYDPFKQSEINGTSYLYNIPRKDNLYATFAILPEGTEANELEWEHYQDNYINFAQDIISKDPFVLYMTSYSFTYGSYYRSVSFDESGNASINEGSRTLTQAVHRIKTRFYFYNLPEGTTAESCIRKIHISSNLIESESLSFSFEDLYSETDDSGTTWICADIYLNYSNSIKKNINYDNICYIIETTGNKIFRTEYSYYFKNNTAVMQTSMNIDYESIK
ncbi:MAG: hypothetical protein ACI4TM_07200 [Candidatus Cryptobacteroides sp.]